MGTGKYIFSKVKFELGKLLRKQSYIYNDKVQEIVKKIKENGFAVVPDFYTQEECLALKKEVDKLVEKRREEKKLWIDPFGADKRCFAAEDDSELIAKYNKNKFCNSVADNVFEGKIECSNTLAAHIEYKEGNIGSGQGWHRDGNHFQFKAIVYLSDVEVKDGPFQIMQGSHKPKNILRDINLVNHDGVNLRFSDNQVQKLVEKYPDNYKVLTAKAGTLVFADTSALHTGMKLSKNGNRYTLFNYYYPSYEDIEARKNMFKNTYKKQSEYE